MRQKMTTNFLSLPYELREQIYSYILPASPAGKEFWQPTTIRALSASTHVRPCRFLLNVNDQITDEVLEYYYKVSS